VTRARTTLLASLMTLGAACSKPGVNAGEEGGVAFIIFAVMLVITYAVLWYFLGRED
jgi:hypothetical protein